MKYGKQFEQLNEEFPEEWQENSIEYKHLKKLLTDVVEELNMIGLNKSKLLDLLLRKTEDTHIEYVLDGPLNQPQPRLIVQFNDNDSREEWLSLYNLQKGSSGLDAVTASTSSTSNKDLDKQHQDNMEEIFTDGTDPSNKEIHIPLNADAKFLGALTAAFDKLEALQMVEKKKFATQVETLCNAITGVTGPSAVNHSTFGLHKKKTNDLYAWREIFTLWVESAIYEGITESSRGERDVESAEIRLNAFAAEVVKRGLGDSRTMKSKRSRQALDQFLELNMALLEIKKFYTANLEAARKILKKHMKMTALPTDSFYSFAGVEGSALQSATSSKNSNFGWTFYTISLPRVLLARLTETLIPIIPSIDDYNCLICQEIAFKPIRLNCTHIFCVRCLVKMQKRGQSDCPLCRAPVVMSANRNNLDQALVGFMELYFPKEVRAKAKANDKEAQKEHMEENGIEDVNCMIM